VTSRHAATSLVVAALAMPLHAAELTGMFTYFADAASIRLCSGGSFPVAMAGDFLALQRAYMDARAEPMKPVLVTVEGRIAKRASMEEGQPPRRTLVVDRFVGAWPRETCGTPKSATPLLGTTWTLVRLDGKPSEVFKDQREPHLVFDAKTSRVSGSGGCNGAGGDFTRTGSRLTFGPFMSTMMACPYGMEQEQRFLAALPRVTRYRIRGSHLDLIDAGGAVVARFEAAAPKKTA